MPQHRILYVGDDAGLPARLKDGLSGFDCFIVRSPFPTARTLIESNIHYSLFLFDQTAAGAELERYARTLPHREHTPVTMIKESANPDGLLDVIKRHLGTVRPR